ncbi:MAG: hypothetical protein ABI867_38730 [Kofleriaceae bacterium]
MTPLAWDRGAWSLSLEIGRMGGGEARVRVAGTLTRGEERLEIASLEGVAGGGIAIVGGRLLEVQVDQLARWIRLLAHEITLSHAELPAFLDWTCMARRAPQLELRDVGVEVVEPIPTCRLVISAPRRDGFSVRAELLYCGKPVAIGGPLTAVVRGKRLVRRRLGDEHTWNRTLRELVLGHGGSDRFTRP